MKTETAKAIAQNPLASERQRADARAVLESFANLSDGSAEREKRESDRNDSLLQIQFWTEYENVRDASERERRAQIVDLLFDTSSETERQAVRERELRSLRAKLVKAENELNKTSRDGFEP